MFLSQLLGKKDAARLAGFVETLLGIAVAVAAIPKLMREPESAG